MPAATKRRPKAETVAPEPEPETPEVPETDDAPGVEAPETPEEDEGETEASLVVTDPEEKALLTNARKLREAARASAEGPQAVEATTEQILLEDERSQRELDLRAVNQQLLGARQALSAAKLNRLLNAAGLLSPDSKQHENQFRQDIHEIRQGIDLLLAIKGAMGATGIDEPALIGLEVPGADGIATLAK